MNMRPENLCSGSGQRAHFGLFRTRCHVCGRDQIRVRVNNLLHQHSRKGR